MNDNLECNWFFAQPVGTRDDYKMTAAEVVELLSKSRNGGKR